MDLHRLQDIPDHREARFVVCEGNCRESQAPTCRVSLCPEKLAVFNVAAYLDLYIFFGT